jgi:hypothetical protein
MIGYDDMLFQGKVRVIHSQPKKSRLFWVILKTQAQNPSQKVGFIPKTLKSWVWV